MKPAELKEFMIKNDLTAIDIASALKMHPNTITNFINEVSFPRRSTVAAFERFVATYHPSKRPPIGGYKFTGNSRIA